MKPLLAHIYEPHRVTYPCYVQPKLNGIRALYQHGRFQSRDEIPFPEPLLQHLSTPLLELFGPGIILDGELYYHGWPLQRINAAVTPVRQQPTEDTKLVEFHVFDVVNFTLPFTARFKHDLLGVQLPIQIKKVETHIAHDEQYADLRYAEFVQLGYEGMMYRLGDCPYTVPKQPNPKGKGFLSDKNNRSWSLLKRKDWQDDEFVCTGIQEGEGKYKGTLGSLTCACPLSKHKGFDIMLTFSVGSGLTDAERDMYFDNPPINRLIKVKYLVLSSDGIPLNPTILAIL